MGKLGFGMTRLPLKSEDPTDFDYVPRLASL